MRLHRRIPIRRTVLLMAVASAAGYGAADRSLVHAKNGKHLALIVGSSHGLPGIDVDMRTATKMVTHADYQFTPTVLLDGPATVANVAEKLTTLSAGVERSGTFLFYFSGHGGHGTLLMEDRAMQISEIRRALEKGREALGPLERLVLIFDSCHSGSLLDPVRRLTPMALAQGDRLNEAFVNDLVAELSKSQRDGAPQYWKSLFVFASSRADETSLASAAGGIFTNAMAKAFDESMLANHTMKEFIDRAYRYTKYHHPVARLSPTELESEKMRP